MSRLRDYNILSSLFPFRPDVPPSTSRPLLFEPYINLPFRRLSIWVYIYKTHIGDLVSIRLL